MPNPDSQQHNQGHKGAGFSDAVEALIPLFLLGAVLLIYWQVTDHGFLTFRDGSVVVNNPHVRGGLTGEDAAWAFRAVQEGLWQPLAWLSHMLDWELYGAYPGWHHLTSVFFHSVNTLLLYSVLRKMTGAVWQSAFVAAVFAVHPVNVESVAWVTERKGVVNAFFWLLTLWSYVRYTERAGWGRYLMCAALFVLGLMSGPLLVTLPFVLLVIDYWPLGRPKLLRATNDAVSRKSGAGTSRLLLEKAPLAALAAISVAGLFLQLPHGAGYASSAGFPRPIDWTGIPLFFVASLEKILWPQSLAVVYPSLDIFSFWPAVGAAGFVVCICVLVLFLWGRYPYFALGWFWYIAALSPAVFLCEAERCPTAGDRFTYLPLIGIFIMIAWGFTHMARASRYRRVALGLGAGVSLSILTGLAWSQTGLWMNSVSLFAHAVKVSPENPVGRNQLGFALACQGKHVEAMEQLAEALRLKPDYAEAHTHMGLVLNEQGRFQEAIQHFSEALKIDPNYAEAHAHWAFALTRSGLLQEAERHYEEALRVCPDDAETHNNLGVVLYGEGRFREAAHHYSEALRIRPDYMDARRNLNNLLRLMGPPPDPLEAE